MNPDCTFTFATKTWRCRRFELCSTDLAGIEVSDLPALVEALQVDARAWKVARRLWGLQPLLPFDEQEDDLRVWSAEELAKSMGLKRGGIAQEIARIAGIWATVRLSRSDHARAAQTERAAAVAAFKPELPLEDPSVGMAELGFGNDLFEAVKAEDGTPRQAAVIRAEKEWLWGRVNDLRKPLTDPMAKSLTQAILHTELQTHRLQHQLARINPRLKEYGGLVSLLGELEDRYMAQLKQLDQIAPWMGKTGGGVSLRSAISEFVRAHQEYYGRQDNRLVDGMFTAMEIQVSMRTPLQRPTVQYYPDIVAMVNAAKANLWNPNWKVPDQLKPSDWKRLCAGWNAAELAVREQLQAEGEHTTPDLMADGPGGEYAEIYAPDEPVAPTAPPPFAGTIQKRTGGNGENGGGTGTLGGLAPTRGSHHLESSHAVDESLGGIVR